MPKFEKQPYNELKGYLEKLLSDDDTDELLDSIVDNNSDRLWDYVVRNKLIAHNLKKLTIKDPELAYLTGKFLGNYHAIEKLFNKMENKKKYDNKLDKIIAEGENAVDLLSDLYIAPAIGNSVLKSKYDDAEKEISIMTEEGIIEIIENEKECYYMLSKKSRKYMKERYFFDTEDDEKVNKYVGKLCSKVLSLLREESKKEE